MSGALLVTGAGGFIGRPVLAVLGTTAGANLLLASRRPLADAPAGSRHVAIDLAADTIELPSGIDTVIHLAGETRDASRMDAVNRRGAARLAEAAARAGVRAFVHLSSVGVYGAPKHAGVVDETAPRHPRGPYETSKAAGEAAVRERCAAHGLRCVVLQPSNVIGLAPGRRPLLGLAAAVARGRFRHVGAGDAWVNYVAVENVAAAVAHAAGTAARDTFIVNTPAPLRDLVGWIAAELGRPPPTATLPAWVSAAAAQVGAAALRLGVRRWPLTPARHLELTNTTRFDGHAIERATGFVYPLAIEPAVRAIVRDYRAEGVL